MSDIEKLIEADGDFVPLSILAKLKELHEENKRLRAVLEDINSEQWAQRGQVDDYALSVLEEIGGMCDQALRGDA
jgi:hypothetical protein